MIPYKDAIQTLSVIDIYPDNIHKFDAQHRRGDCPKHQSKSGSSFNVDPDTKEFWCKGCGFKGDPVDYYWSMSQNLPNWESCPKSRFIECASHYVQKAFGTDAKDYLGKSVETSIKTTHKANYQAVLADFYELCHDTLLSDSDYSKQALDYILSRGISLETIKRLKIGLYPKPLSNDSSAVYDYLIKQKNHYWKGEFGVQSLGITNTEKYVNYLTFPWLNSNGKPLTCYFRYANANVPDGKDKTRALKKYENVGSKSSPLFFNRCLENNSLDIFAVEGPIDALSLIEHGVDNVVAYVAASFSEEQMQTLKSHGVKSVTIIGDSDEGGYSGLISSTTRLTNLGIDCYSVTLPKGHDPNSFIVEFGWQQWEDLIGQKKSSFSTIVDNVFNKVNPQPNSDVDYNRVLNAVREVYKKIDEEELDKSTIHKIDLFLWSYCTDKLCQLRGWEKTGSVVEG